MTVNSFYKQCINCIFTVHAVCTVHNYFIIVTHTLCLSETSMLCSLVIKDYYYYHHCHSHDFCLQTN